jgi:hypothetical protein
VPGDCRGALISNIALEANWQSSAAHSQPSIGSTVCPLVSASTSRIPVVVRAYSSQPGPGRRGEESEKEVDAGLGAEGRSRIISGSPGTRRGSGAGSKTLSAEPWLLRSELLDESEPSPTSTGWRRRHGSHPSAPPSSRGPVRLDAVWPECTITWRLDAESVAQIGHHLPSLRGGYRGPLRGFGL